VLEYKAKNKRPKETLLSVLADLFYTITTQKKKVGSIAPKKFIARLRKDKGKPRISGIQEIIESYHHAYR
jgi:ubiquitin carboxyl-terminal hydrolase 12/46